MASLVPGYEYDIFISYRQNDNRSGWVTEFVSALQEELASTIKESISVYFDTNPHNGLLETHNVVKSLEGKLKCLIFIPVISQTYCDPGSFAWQKEFLAFNKLADADQFGRDIRLASGNVSSRVLPVKIHNLDPEDIKLLENELGGVLRSIDFIYTEAGVNRPLRPNDEAKDNLNKTRYRNQINKLANAIKEIVSASRVLPQDKSAERSENIIASGTRPSIKRSNFKRGRVVLTAIICLIAAAYFILPHVFNSTSGAIERSIAVLPLENMSTDPDQEYFSAGMMQEILNHLFMIGGLKIPSGSSSMRFKDSKLPVKEIARELGVSYILEGNVSISGDNVRIIVMLINGKNDQMLWSEDYRRTLTAINLLDIQSDVAQKVAESLKVVMNPDVKKRMISRPTENTEAYLLFLHATQEMGQNANVRQMLEKAIVLDPEYSDAYAALAFYWLIQGNDLYGKLSRNEVLEKTDPLLKKALQLDNNSVMAHSYFASIDLWYNWDFKSVNKEFQIVNQLNPSSSDAYLEFVQYLLITGKFSDALDISKKSFENYDGTGQKYVALALSYCYCGQKEKALETVDSYLNLFKTDNFMLYNSMRIYNSLGEYNKVIDLFSKYLGNRPINDLSDCFLGYMGIAYFKSGQKDKSDEYLNELLTRSLHEHTGSPSYYIAEVYTSRDQTEEAIGALQKALTNHEAEMVWLKVCPVFSPLHADPRFKGLLKQIGLD